MSQLVSCPECKKHLQVPDDLMGKKVQCPECKHTFTAQAPEEEEVKSKPGTSIAKSSPTKKAEWDRKADADDDDDDDDRKANSGKKKRRDDDDADDDDERS